jgi:ADP-heptose:LPS heptosyltransferase
MQIKLMQWVDYYVGIPLCFILSIFRKIIRLLYTRSKSNPRKILFIELSEMGSAIIAYSSIHKAQEIVGKENVYFLIFNKNRESVELLSIIPEQNIICINDSSLLAFFVSCFQFFITTRRIGIDTIIDLELFSRCTTLLSFLSGARIRVGFYNFEDEGLYRGELLTHKVLYNVNQHMAQNFLAMVLALNADTKDLPLLKQKTSQFVIELPQYTSTENEKLAIEIIFKNKSISNTHPIIIFNPDPGLLALRGWPLVYYAELAKKILAQYQSAKILIIGLSSSKPMAERIIKLAESNRVFEIVGSTKNLKELVTLFNHCDLLITADSGPAHMASLTTIKSIVLFGPETPVRYKPLGTKNISLTAGLACSPCYSAANHRKSICKNNQCMQSLSVDEVFSAVENSLN